MNKKLLFIIILSICVLFGAIDFVFNGYTSKLNLTASVFNLKDSSQALIQKVESYDETLKLAQQTTSLNLFNKMNLEKVEEIKQVQEILFTKNNAPYLKFYILDFKTGEHAQNFLSIKKLFKDLESQVDSISLNQTDDYGLASFYVNDTENETTVTLITLTQNGVWGIEYSKENTNTIKESLENLTKF